MTASLSTICIIENHRKSLKQFDKKKVFLSMLDFGMFMAETTTTFSNSNAKWK